MGSDKKLYQKPEDLEKKLSQWAEPTFTEGGKKILAERYLLQDETRKAIETPREMLYRVAHVISAVDADYNDFDSEKTEKEFYEMMARGIFLPNSPTLKGAGLGINLSACYVVPIGDSREEIFQEALYRAVEIQAHGGGTGFNFSKLRAKGSLIRSTNGKASGPVSFMGDIDQVIGNTIAQGGTRQGANMGILRYDHPDIDLFIHCKEKDGDVRNFNLSVGITNEFMNLVKADGKYDVIDHKGKKVGERSAKELFNEIVHHAWKTGDPGIIYLDRINNDNPTPALGTITATNPCGEQPLLELEACNLGSINVGKFVIDGKIDWENLGKTVYSAIHFLDNVIDANTYPLKKSERELTALREVLSHHIKDAGMLEGILSEYEESPVEKMVKGNRKIGLGIMGFSDLLISMNIGYGTDESYKVATQVMGFIHEKSRDASVKLAETRGVFPNWKGSIFDPDSQYFKGRELKIRNACTNTIAPTGTISTVLGASSGIEPMFGLAYERKSVYDEAGNAKIKSFIVDSGFERIAKEEGFYNENLIQQIVKNKGSLEGVRRPSNISLKRWRELKEMFITANDLPYTDHIKMQDAFQHCVDNAISKTINMPSDAPEEDVRNAYLMTADTIVKGITVYRDGVKGNQVLTTGVNASSEDGRPEVIGTTIKQPTPFGKAFITLNLLMADGKTPYESFVTIGKGGEDIDAIAEGYGRLISLAIKGGVQLEEIVEQLEGINGETKEGFGKKKVKSLPDAVVTGLKKAYSLLTETEWKAGENLTGNLCPKCGSQLMMAEGCQKCSDPECGFSKCG